MHRLLLAAVLLLVLGRWPCPVAAQDLIRGPVTPLDQSSVQLAVDSRQPLGQVGEPDGSASYRLRGWAADLSNPGGPGIRQIVAYLDGPSDRGRLLGWARVGLARPDVATVFNDPGLTRCGFELTWPVTEVPPQSEPVHTYMIYLYLDTERGWVGARLPVALTLAADSTPET
ncbi:MAG TPA: hypothetical protein VK066_04570 [Chloroflexota bacterium]|nr:hypothetical protein [Chloroflexota bacterium]